ncbi:hypothetical protein [Mediterraneibacter gnavus]|uniref:hypothetical protein n=1 Tax=Mediterraneibacter gnavus TaxID=33038 RepID=UPI0032B7C375
MGYEIVMCVMALFVNLLVVGCFALVYGTKMKYENGMLFGIHMPKEAQQDPEVKTLMERYTIRMKQIYWWSTAGAVISGVLAFTYTSIFMFGWMFWLFAFTIGSMGCICRYHRKLYDIKVKNRWFAGTGANIVVIDTAASAQAEEKQIRALWHLPAFLIFVILCLMSEVRAWIQEETVHLLVPVTAFLVTGVFWGLHVWSNRRRCEPYSENTQINTAIHVRERRMWAWIWLVGTYTSLIGMGEILWQISRKGYLDVVDTIICVIFSMAGGLFILAAILWMMKKRQELLKTEEPLSYVDDDIYWKNGWYNNPRDRRWVVPSRMCSSNYSFNMGKPGVRYLTGALGSVIVIGVLWLVVVFFGMDFVRPQLSIDGNQVTVRSAEYGISFARKEIEDAELLENLPEEDFVRINGLSDSRQLLGKFKGEESGKAMFYIRRGETPVLKIKLPEYTVFINSEESGKVKEWYEELSS